MLKRTLFLSPLIMLIGTALAFLFYSPSSEATPPVNWKPPAISLELGVGQSTSMTVTFLPSRDEEHVDVFVVPELQPYVTVSPASFASIKAGMIYEVGVTVVTDINALLGTYEGTVHLRRGKRTLSQPLPFTLKVTTLGNVDEDKDGLWDDYQRFIGDTYKDRPLTQRAARQFGLAFQDALLASGDKEGSVVVASSLQRAIECLWSLEEGSDATELRKEMMRSLLNSDARARAYWAFNQHLAGQIYPINHPDVLSTSCD